LMSATVVLAKVPQSALLPPVLVMAEMKAVGVMLEKANCIIIPSGTTEPVVEGRASHLYAARATRTRSLKAMIVFVRSPCTLR